MATQTKAKTSTTNKAQPKRAAKPSVEETRYVRSVAEKFVKTAGPVERHVRETIEQQTSRAHDLLDQVNSRLSALR